MEPVGEMERIESTKLTITVQKTERSPSQLQAYDNGTQSPMVTRTMRQSPSNNGHNYTSQSNLDKTEKAVRRDHDAFSNEIQSPQHLNMPQMMEINIRRINQQGDSIKPTFSLNNGAVNIQLDSNKQYGISQNLRNSQGEISFQEQTNDNDQANHKRSKKRNKNGKFNNTFHASKFSVGVVEGSQLIPQHQQMLKTQYNVKKVNVRVKTSKEKHDYSPEKPHPYQSKKDKISNNNVTAMRRTSRLSDNLNHSSQYNQDIDDCDEYANLKQSFNVTQLGKDLKNDTLYKPRGSAINNYNDEVQPKIVLQQNGKESSGEARSTTTHKAQSNEVSMMNQSQPKMPINIFVGENQDKPLPTQASVFSNRRPSQNQDQAITPISNSQLLPREAIYSPSDHGGYSEHQHIHRSTYSNQHNVNQPQPGGHGPIQQLYQFVDSSNLVPMNNNDPNVGQEGQQSGEVTFSPGQNAYDYSMDPNFDMQNEFMQHLFQQNIISAGGNLSQDPQKAQYIQQLQQLAQMTGFAPQPNLLGGLNLPLGPQFSHRQTHPFARSARPPPVHKKDALNGGVWPQAIHKVANISQSQKVNQLLMAQKKKQEKADQVAHTTRSVKPPTNDILSHSMCRFTQSILNSQVKMNVDPTRWMPTGSLVIDNKIAPPNFKVTQKVLKMPNGTSKVNDQNKSVSPKNKNAYIKIENINQAGVNIPSRLNDQSPDFLQEASIQSNKTNFNIMSSRRLQTLKNEAKLTDKFQNGALVAQKAVINQINIKQAIAQLQYQQMKSEYNKSSGVNNSQIQNPDNIDIMDHHLPSDDNKVHNKSSDKTRSSPGIAEIGLLKGQNLSNRFRGNTSVISSIQNAPERDSKMIETMLTDFKKNSNSKANLIANHIDSTNSIQQTTNSGQNGKTLHQESQTFATILLNKKADAQKTNSESNLKTNSAHFRSRYDNNNEDMTFQAIVNTEMSQTNIGFAVNLKMEDDYVIKEAAQEQEITVATPVGKPIKIPKLNDTFTVGNGFKETFGINNPIKEEDMSKTMYSQMKSTGLSKRGREREGMQLVPTIFPIIGQKGQVVNDKNQTFSKKKISVSKATPDQTHLTKDYSEIDQEKKVIHVIPHINQYGTKENSRSDYNSNDAQTLREASTSMMNQLQPENSLQNIQTAFLYKKDYSSRNKIFTPRSNLGKNSPHGTHSRKEEDQWNNYSQHPHAHVSQRSQNRKVDNDDLGEVIEKQDTSQKDNSKKNVAQGQRNASKTRNELIRKINTESKTVIPKGNPNLHRFHSPVRITEHNTTERQRSKEHKNEQSFADDPIDRIITETKKNEERQLAIVNFERDLADVTESHFGARSITINTRQTTRGGEGYEEVAQIRPALSCNPGLPSAFQNKKYHYSLEGRGQQIYTQRNLPPTIKAQTQQMKGKKKFMPPNSNIKPIKYRVLNIKDQKEQQDKKEQTKRQSIVDQFTHVMNQTQRLKTKQGFWTGYTNHDAEVAKKVQSSLDQDSNEHIDNTMEHWEEYENSDRPLDQTIGNFGQHFQYDSDGERQYSFVKPSSRDRGFPHQNNSFSIPGSKMPNFTQKAFGMKNNSFLNQRTAQAMDLGVSKFGHKKNTTQIYSNTVYMKQNMHFPTLSDKLSAIRDKKSNKNSDDYSSFLTRNQIHNQNIIRQRQPKPQNLKQYMMHNTISPQTTHHRRQQPQLAPIDVLATTPYGQMSVGGANEDSYSPLFSPGYAGQNHTFADMVNKQQFQPNKTGRLPFDQQANTTFTASIL